MKKRLGALLFTLFLLLSPLPAAAASTSANLLANPSFEDGLAGWTSPDGKWGTAESESGYDPQDGSYFAWPLQASQENTCIYQDVSLSGSKTGDSVVFSVMVCNYDQPPHDMGRVELQFLDPSGKPLKGHIQEQRNPDWNQQTIIASVPAGAVTARVVLWAVWYVGSDVDAYYDAASLVTTTDQYSTVYVSEKNGKETAGTGDVLTLTADNGVSRRPDDYVWSSSYNDAATIDANGVVTFHSDAQDGVAFYAKDKKTGVVGVYWVNSGHENAKPASGSSWASADLRQADELGLIPECLEGTDLTAPITRAEFAAVAVKTYEALTNSAAIPAANNPFRDTKDADVLKAYRIGAVNGTSDTTFAPNALLNREQAATMLTRVFKKVSLAGWTLQADGDFSPGLRQTRALCRRRRHLRLAKDSVYFMAANGIIQGSGGKFMPRSVTSAQQAGRLCPGHPGTGAADCGAHGGEAGLISFYVPKQKGERRMKRRMFALTLAVLLALSAAGCGGGNQKALVGTWEITDDAGSAYGWGIRFDQDGTFFFAAGAEDNDEELEEAFAAMQVLYTIEYKVKSDTELELTQKLLGGLGGKETTSVAYSLQGDTLIFDGTAYTRVN